MLNSESNTKIAEIQYSKPTIGYNSTMPHLIFSKNTTSSPYRMIIADHDSGAYLIRCFEISSGSIVHAWSRQTTKIIGIQFG